ncbi:zinc metalloproteinase nas-4-like [Lineus longissimus]|uniref:zinc metalloproteinase nas-4-like n=1 Tax=Lineus longissimus TaxID=88925 RepID=UPI00315D4825
MKAFECWSVTIICVVFLTKETTANEKKADEFLQNPELFQGDIQYPLPSTFRNGILGKYTKWVNNTVPYAFLDAEGFRYTAYEKRKIVYGMETMEQELIVNGKKCITFKPRDKEIGHLFFVRSGGCSSPVGQPYSANYVHLEPGCLGKSTLHHELMHSLGFYHEQSRTDRDDYITIHWENMDKGVYSQFKKYPATKVTAYGEPYDLNSVMHYGYNFFSNNGKPTISVKNGGRLGALDRLSIHDKRKIQKRYGCEVAPLPGTVATTTTTTTTPGPDSAVVSCNFDSQGWCGIQLLGSEQRWSIQNDGGDHTTGSGYAARFTVRQDEVKNFNRNSDLSLTSLSAGQQYCLTFWYKLDGSGQLKVTLGGHKTLKEVDAQRGWNRVKVNASTTYTDDLRIFVQVGENQYGSINIDDVVVTRGSC